MLDTITGIEELDGFARQLALDGAKPATAEDWNRIAHMRANLQKRGTR